MSKTALIDEILQNQGGEKDVARSAKQVRPMITMMVQMAKGKPEDVDAFSRKLAEALVPLVKEAAREQYAVLFSDEQLESLAAFHRDNPWYHDLSCELTEAMSAATTDKAANVLKEIFDQYLSADEDEGQ